MRTLISLLILVTLLTACGADGAGAPGVSTAVQPATHPARSESPSPSKPTPSLTASGDVKAHTPGVGAEALARDLEDVPFHWPCQADTKGEKVQGSPATYVRGPAKLIGCIKDRDGRGIQGASTGVEVGSVSDATVTLEFASPIPTDKAGRYYERNAKGPGWWVVTAYAPGYKQLTKRVRVNEGWTAVLDYALEPLGRRPTPVPTRSAP